MVLGIWRLTEANLALILQIGVLILTAPVFPALQRRLGKWREPLLGFMLGCTILARLDLVFFVAIVLIYEFLRRANTPRNQSLALQISIMTVVIAPYLIWNVYFFHHIMPISGATKSTFPHFQPWHFELFMIPVIVSVLLNVIFLLMRERTTFVVLCVITAAATALHLIYTLSFGDMAPWYMTTGYLNVSLSIIWLVDYVLTRRPSLAWVETAAVFLLFAAFLTLASLRLFSNFSYARLTQGRVSFHGIYYEPGHALAIKLRETLPLGSRIYVFDAPGGVAFYSGMSILPSDGLVTDYTYNTDLGMEGFVKYAKEHQIDYFITTYLQPGHTDGKDLGINSERTSAGQLMHIVVPLTHQSAGSITLSDSDLLFRSNEINPYFETRFPEVGVWRIQN